MSSTPLLPTRIIPWRVNAYFIARYMPLTGTRGSTRCLAPFRRLVPQLGITSFSWAIPLTSTRFATEGIRHSTRQRICGTHSCLSEHKYRKENLGCRSRREISIGLRWLVHCEDARSAGSDRGSDWIPNARLFATQTGKMIAAVSIFRESYQAAMESRFVYRHEHASIRISNGNDYWM